MSFRLIFLFVAAAEPHRLLASVDRSAGLGAPNYTLSVYADGQLEWDGKVRVNVLGHKVAQLSPSQMLDLRKAFADADFFQRKDGFDAPDCSKGTDASVVRTSYDDGTQRKVFRASQCAPAADLAAINRLDRRFDEIVGSDRWIRASREEQDELRKEKEEGEHQTQGSLLVETELAVTLDGGAVGHADDDPRRPYFATIKLGEGTVQVAAGQLFARWHYTTLPKVKRSVFRLASVSPTLTIRVDSKVRHVGQAFVARGEHLLEACAGRSKCWPIRLVYTPTLVTDASPTLRVQGALRSDVVASVFRENHAALHECFAREQREKPEAEGTVETQLSISSEGRVAMTKVMTSTMQNPKVENCILGILRGMIFPKPTSGIAIVNYRFAF